MKNIKQILLILIIVLVSYLAYSYLFHNAVIDWNMSNPQYKI